LSLYYYAKNKKSTSLFLQDSIFLLFRKLILYVIVNLKNGILNDFSYESSLHTQPNFGKNKPN